MKVEVIKRFIDKTENGKTRKLGEEFEVTEERFEEINAAGYGELVKLIEEKVQKPIEEKEPAKKKSKSNKKESK